MPIVKGAKSLRTMHSTEFVATGVNTVMISLVPILLDVIVIFVRLLHSDAICFTLFEALVMRYIHRFREKDGRLFDFTILHL